MINIKEIRIDNWVNDSKKGYCQVNGIQLHSSGETYVFLVNDGMEFQHRANIKNLSPIVLTAEILEKCGFVFKKNGSCELGKFIVCEPDRDGFTVFLAAGDVGYDTNLLDIQYLHQLQNLYFVLSGEELQIKLP